MNRILSCAAAAAFFSMAGCGGGSQDQQARAPVEPPPQSNAISSDTPAGAPTGPSNDQAPPVGAGTSASMNAGPNGSTSGPGVPSSGTSATADSTSRGSGMTADSTSSGSSATTGGTGIGGGAISTPTDEQILQALHTANSGEIEQAKLAQRKSKNAQVKHFASMMVKEQTAADRKGKEVAKTMHVSPSVSSISSSLESDARQQTSSMSSRTGADFDRAYMDAQVKEHQSLLDLIDNQLLPNAKAAEVKAHLQTVRSTVQSHLKEAQDIQRKLAGT